VLGYRTYHTLRVKLGAADCAAASEADHCGPWDLCGGGAAVWVVAAVGQLALLLAVPAVILGSLMMEHAMRVDPPARPPETEEEAAAAAAESALQAGIVGHWQSLVRTASKQLQETESLQRTRTAGEHKEAHSAARARWDRATARIRGAARNE
jgi:hypothetical protein